MKKILILSMLISFTIICSCQKQDSATEQEFAQRKMELDARENALDERMSALDEKVKALDEKVKMLAENQKGMANAGTRPTGVQDELPDPAQVEAERERIQQLSAEMRARMTDPSRIDPGKSAQDPGGQKRRLQTQPGLEQLQGQKQRKSKMSNGAVFPAPEINSPAQSSTAETTAPTLSPATEAASPTPSPAR